MNRLLSVFCALFLLCPSTWAGLRIHEFMASNGQTLADNFGDFSDWIELLNVGETELHLGGWALSDDLDQPRRWIFPDVTVGPGEFLLVWASGRNLRQANRPLHTNFAISAGGEPLILTRPDETVVDQVPSVFLPRDVSYGRSEAEPDTWLYFLEATPGAPNTTSGVSGFLDAPTASFMGVPGRFPFSVSFHHPDPAATIRITFDGAEPGDDSPAYEGPVTIGAPVPTLDGLAHIRTNPPEADDRGFGWRPPTAPVDQAVVMRARAHREGFAAVDEFAVTWFAKGTFAGAGALPVVSLLTDPAHLFDHETGLYLPGRIYVDQGFNFEDWTGSPAANYFQAGSNWERPAHFEFFDGSTGQRLSAGSVGFRIHGAATRALPLKSLRLYERQPDSSGGALQYPFFGDASLPGFRTLLLRNGGQDFLRTHLRDPLAQKIVKHLSFETQAYEPVRLYLNGEYWGILNMRERLDGHFLEERYDLGGHSIDRLLLGFFVEADDGDTAAWSDFLFEMFLLDPAHPASYPILAQAIDMENHIDFHISQIFLGNFDWPGNNVRVWRARTQLFGDRPHAPDDGRFRWLMYDVDAAFDGFSKSAAYNMLIHATRDDSDDWPYPRFATRLLRYLLESEAYRSAFIRRFADLLNSTFLPARTEALLDQLAARIAPAMPAHIDRWGYPVSFAAWVWHLEEIASYLEDRPDHQWSHLVEFFDLGSLLEVSVFPSPGGHVRLNSLHLRPDEPGMEAYGGGIWRGWYPADLLLEVEAVAAPGYRFLGWIDDAAASPTRSLFPAEAVALEPLFEPDPSSWPVAPHPLAEGVYALNQWDAGSPAGAAPPALYFPLAAQQDPGWDALIASVWQLPYNLSNRSRVVGLGEGGIGFVNTGNAQDVDDTGYVTGAVLALDTREVSYARVESVVGTVLPNERTYAFRLQYRVGPSGPFRDLPDTEGQPIVYVRGGVGETVALPTAVLPLDALGHPYVEVFWRYHSLGFPESGPRAFLRVASIEVSTRPAILPDTPFWRAFRGLDEHSVWHPFMGSLWVAAYPWVYGPAHGWFRIEEGSGDLVYFWDPLLGWFFTSPAIYPLYGRYSDDGTTEWLVHKGFLGPRGRFIPLIPHLIDDET